MPEIYAQDWWLIQRFGKQRYLLLSLVAILVLQPLLSSQETSRFWTVMILTLIMVTGPLALATQRFDFYFTLLLGVVMASTSWLGNYVEGSVVMIIDQTTTVLFFLMLGVLIFKQFIFSNDGVTEENLFAAVNAYLCIGIMYAFAYRFLMLIDPSALSGTFLGDHEISAYVYLSFVTITTLGYGDITPQSELAAILTYSEAVMGQFFMALVVARIVGIWVADKQR